MINTSPRRLGCSLYHRAQLPGGHAFLHAAMKTSERRVETRGSCNIAAKEYEMPSDCMWQGFACSSSALVAGIMELLPTRLSGAFALAAVDRYYTTKMLSSVGTFVFCSDHVVS